MKVLKDEMPDINWRQTFTIEFSLKELLILYDAFSMVSFVSQISEYKNKENIPYSIKENDSFYKDFADLVENKIDIEKLHREWNVAFIWKIWGEIMIYKLTLGDWSKDGHGQYREFLFDCNYGVHKIREAYKDSC